MGKGPVCDALSPQGTYKGSFILPGRRDWLTRQRSRSQRPAGSLSQVTSVRTPITEHQCGQAQAKELPPSTDSSWHSSEHSDQEPRHVCLEHRQKEKASQDKGQPAGPAWWHRHAGKYTGLEKRKVSQNVNVKGPYHLCLEGGGLWPGLGLAQQDVSIWGSAGPLSCLHIP